MCRKMVHLLSSHQDVDSLPRCFFLTVSRDAAVSRGLTVLGSLDRSLWRSPDAAQANGRQYPAYLMFTPVRHLARATSGTLLQS